MSGFYCRYCRKGDVASCSQCFTPLCPDGRCTTPTPILFCPTCNEYWCDECLQEQPYCCYCETNYCPRCEPVKQSCALCYELKCENVTACRACCEAFGWRQVGLVWVCEADVRAIESAKPKNTLFA